MNHTAVLKALADDTRLAILKLLLQHRYCVRALSIHLGISDAAVSQHLKVLREADLLYGEKKGRYMHYQVNRDALRELATDIDALANLGLNHSGQTGATPSTHHRQQASSCTQSMLHHYHCASSDKYTSSESDDAVSEGGPR